MGENLFIYEYQIIREVKRMQPKRRLDLIERGEWFICQKNAGHASPAQSRVEKSDITSVITPEGFDYLAEGLVIENQTASPPCRRLFDIDRFGRVRRRVLGIDATLSFSDLDASSCA